MTTRQDLLELREELQEVARTGKENLELAVTRLGRAAPEAGLRRLGSRSFVYENGLHLTKTAMHGICQSRRQQRIFNS